MTIYAPKERFAPVDEGVCRLRDFNEAERMQIQLYFLRGRQAMQVAGLRELTEDYFLQSINS